MAFASIIASAIGILLLIITAYVLVGGVLTTTQIAMNAQSEMTAVHMQTLATSFAINSSKTVVDNGMIYLSITNSGSEQIDLSHTDVFLTETLAGTAPILIKTWSLLPPNTNKVLWRPTEVLNMSIAYGGTYPVKIQITTGNGVSAITEVPPP